MAAGGAQDMIERDPKRVALKRLRHHAAAVREELADWDFLGTVSSGGPRDEYECLVWPIIRRIQQGAAPDAAAEWLVDEIRDHFTVNVPKPSAAAFLLRLQDWCR
jgi:hypothetical protein